MSSEPNTCKCGATPFMDSEPVDLMCSESMHTHHYWVECENCDRTSSIETSKQAAIDDWNNG